MSIDATRSPYLMKSSGLGSGPVCAYTSILRRSAGPEPSVLSVGTVNWSTMSFSIRLTTTSLTGRGSNTMGASGGPFCPQAT